MNICVVVPTYNEKENIGSLVAAVFEIFEENNLNGRLIIVDDNSPDRTAEEVKRLIPKYHIQLIERPGKLGLGSAYVEGFKKALSQGCNIIFEMDADLSHDPAHIPAFLENIKGCDVVIGSRYIPGGGIRGWGPGRKAVSWGGNLLARTLMGLNARDITTGYRAYRREVLEDIDLESMRSNGYEFQAEMLYLAQKRGFRIKETPIVFRDRAKGKSKLSKKEIINFFRLCMGIGLRRLLRR